MERRRWLVCYDVADDRRRRRVERALLGLGQRVQYSVFECLLTYPEARLQLGAIADELEKGADSLRAYPLCIWCAGEVSVLGATLRPDSREEQGGVRVVVL